MPSPRRGRVEGAGGRSQPKCVDHASAAHEANPGGREHRVAGAAPIAWFEDRVDEIDRQSSGARARRAFGTPGADAGLGFASVMNNMNCYFFDDPREKALRDAVHHCIRRLSG